MNIKLVFRFFCAFFLIGITPLISMSQGKILSTTNFVGDAVAKIAGDDFELQIMMQAGVDPHLYKATAGDLRRLIQADVIFYNGLTLEAKFADVLSKMKDKAFAVSAKVPEEKILYFNDQQSIPDPHIWFDPTIWTYVFEKIADVLIQKFPQHKEKFEARKNKYVAEMKALDEWALENLKSLPPKNRVLVTAHDAFSYFANRYGFELYGLQGNNTQSEMSLARLNEVTNLIVEKKVKSVFVENTISPKTIEALILNVKSKNHDVKKGGILLSDSLGDPNKPEGEYIGAFKANIQTIMNALK